MRLLFLCGLLLILLLEVYCFRNPFFELTKLSKFSRSQLGLSTNDFKNGIHFEVDGQPVRLIEFLHVKPGKGAAFVRSKIKYVITGNIQERSFRSGESFVPATIDRLESQFTYSEGNIYHFLDHKTFEDILVEKSQITNLPFLKEGMMCQVMFWNEKVLEVILPKNAVFKVVETGSTSKDSTTTSGTSMKVAKLDSGATIQVPIFISEGQDIQVNIEEGKYMAKA